MLIFNGLSDFTGRMEHFLAATADSTTLLPLLVMLVLLVVRQFDDDADIMFVISSVVWSQMAV